MFVEEQVRKIIAQTLEVDEVIITEKELLYSGLNSLSFIKIIVRLEEYFEIKFDDNNLKYELFSTIEDIIKYVRAKSQA
ncbi:MULTISPECIES: acyl carrier protein [Paenibacillus]|uniref:acyl carrier protein n=1 Tax=Paenibacillus TaxID=44249 RepID=UPI0013E95DC8|nr:acyl carrier protein [Paenibacillus sp. EKM211P]KAF6582689.1 acyl carrier protein [Paenibacillus sp. EKM211P]MEE4562223.1 acyl carrier protein [Paenibacillus polymyxa]